MRWETDLFVRNAELFSLVLEGMQEQGKQSAKVISDYLVEKGMRGCKILDVPCGIGRITIPLAKLGFTVTGVDFSPYFIRIAKTKAKQSGVEGRTSFMEGRKERVDSLLKNETFDVAINVFTSIGYGSEEADQVFFRSLRRVVRKGGLFVIAQLANRDYIFSHFMEHIYDETDKLLVLETNELDAASSREKSVWRFYMKTGKSLRAASEVKIDLRLYSPHELASMLEGSAWRVSDIYDSLSNKKPFSVASSSYTVVAEAV